MERSTERLLLRRWRDEDIVPFAAMCADPRVMEFFPAPLTFDEAEALAHRLDARFDSDGYSVWAIERRDTAEFIGFTGLIPMPDGVPGSDGIEVGWRLAAEHWGHGFASEAARESLSFGFSVLGLPELNSITTVGNLRSRRVMERIGMHLHGRFDHPRLPPDSPLRPHVRYVIRSPHA